MLSIKKVNTLDDLLDLDPIISRHLLDNTVCYSDVGAVTFYEF